MPLSTSARCHAWPLGDRGATGPGCREVTVLFDGPPQILSSAADRYNDFVQIPGVTHRRANWGSFYAQVAPPGCTELLLPRSNWIPVSIRACSLPILRVMASNVGAHRPLV